MFGEVLNTPNVDKYQVSIKVLLAESGKKITVPLVVTKDNLDSFLKTLNDNGTEYTVKPITEVVY